MSKPGTKRTTKSIRKLVFNAFIWDTIPDKVKKRNNRTPDDACSTRPKNGRLADCRADNIAYEFKLSDQLYLLTNKERDWVTATKHVSYVKPNTSEELCPLVAHYKLLTTSHRLLTDINSSHVTVINSSVCFDHRCYIFYKNGSFTWMEAEQFCITNHMGHLLSINTDVEWDTLLHWAVKGNDRHVRSLDILTWNEVFIGLKGRLEVIMTWTLFILPLYRK